MMGNLTPDQIEEVLRTEVIGRIACIADGWPYIVPVTYVYDGGEFVFSHSAEGHKIEAMRQNPHVCFEVEQIKSIASWRTVIARGRFEQLSHDAEERAMDLLGGKFAWFAPGVTPTNRREDVHRREGIIRPVLFQIRLLDRTGRFELT
jgi:nitroimidazol reductase NimA-like FMN-containing flavoprotein (pyridoxamine 5'-phosphate oxidase superfamily)